MKKKDDALYLQHMLEAIEEVHVHLKHGRDLTVRRAVERCLEIIGEAANRISPALQKAHPEVPWRTIINARNIIIHDYDDLRVDIIWDTAKIDLPVLEKQVKKIIAGLPINQ